MGFLEVKPKIFEHFWRNSGKIFRPYFGIFVARPRCKSYQRKKPGLMHMLFFSFREEITDVRRYSHM